MAPTPSNPGPVDTVPLFVDLDGTLVATDTTVEACFRLIRRNAGYAVRLPLWLLRGRAHLKRCVSRRMPLPADQLPYREDVLAFLRTEHAAGRRTILATAADEDYARAVADHLGCFDAAVGSDGVTDLAGGHKLDRIRSMSGGGAFDYAGDDIADIVIFRHARKSIIAHPVPALRLAARRLVNVERVFDAEPRRVIDVLDAFRLRRWPLNLLILLPFALSGGPAGLGWVEALLAVLSFCLGASAIHLYNDLLNIEKHRRLPPDSRGPIATGRVAIQRAGEAIPILAVPAFALAAWVSGPFLLALAAAFVLAVLAAQDWLAIPPAALSLVLNLLRAIAGIVLLPVPPSLPILIGSAVVALAVGALEARFVVKPGRSI